VQCGTSVFAGGHWRRPGILGDQVLIARPAIMKPSPVAEAGGVHGAGAEALGLLRTWNWKRQIDPILLLGWIGCGFLGAALPWRPMLWVIGPTSTGKSTLQRAIEGIYGGWLVKAVEPSAAGVWQTLRHDCLPIAIDEAESDTDNRRLNGLVKLARACASGDRLLRGSSEGAASEYSLRSCVMFSSIRHPPLLAQDRNRIIILRLGEMMGEVLPDLAPKRLLKIGERILQRVVSGWSRWRSLPQCRPRFAPRSPACRSVTGHSRGQDGLLSVSPALADRVVNITPPLDGFDMAVHRGEVRAHRHDRYVAPPSFAPHRNIPRPLVVPATVLLDGLEA
jgi:hypothetical protein